MKRPNPAQRMFVEMLSLRNAWIDAQFQQRVPPEIYDAAHSPKLGDKLKAREWMDKHAYRIQISDDGFIVEIWQADERVARGNFKLEVRTVDVEAEPVPESNN